MFFLWQASSYPSVSLSPTQLLQIPNNGEIMAIEHLEPQTTLKSQAIVFMVLFKKENGNIFDITRTS